jgi:hypothetical protein
MGYMDLLKFVLMFLFLLNCYVSVKVFMDVGLTRTQKILQLIIIWALPFIGGVVVFLVHRIDEEPKGPSNHRSGDDGHDGMPGGIQ